MSLELSDPSTTSPPSRSLALKSVKVLDETILEVLLGDTHVHSAVRGEGSILQLGGGRLVDGTALDNGVEAVLNKLLGGIAVEVPVTDNHDTEEVLGLLAEPVEAGSEVKVGEGEEVLGSGGRGKVGQGETWGQSVVGDNSASNLGEVSLAENLLLTVIEVEGGEVGRSGLNGDEETLGLDLSLLAVGIGNGNENTILGALGPDDSRGVEDVLAEKSANSIVEVLVASSSRDNG